MTGPDAPRVLIVGAGPVGLVLACELVAHGVQVDVVSRARHTGVHSRATILWPRILELLDRTGVAEKLVAGGHYFDQMNYYSNKRRIGRIRFDRLPGVAYPFAITIPQWRTETVLEEHLRTLGGEVHYGQEFLTGTQTPDGVEVLLRVEDCEVTRSYSWVVGADGYDSAVRRDFGFGYEGHALQTRLAITDAEILGESTSSEAAYYLTRTGNMVLAPLGDGVFRVGASVPHGWESSEPDRTFFETLLQQRVPGNRRLGRMTFSGMFVAQVRSAGSFRQGRVFLLGDAAHVMSPSGAQGLNTGIQDAVNLGWKLAGVITERYRADLLDSYDSERRPAVDEVARLSTTLARISLYSTRPATAARDLAYRLGSVTTLLESVLAPRLAQIDTRYPVSSPAVGGGRRRRGPVPGARMPLGWRSSSTAPVLATDRPTVLLWPGAAYRHEAWAVTAARLAEAMPDAAVRDLAGRPPGPLLPMLGHGAEALVVRPDGHLHAIVPLTGKGVTDVAAHLPSRPALPLAS